MSSTDHDRRSHRSEADGADETESAAERVCSDSGDGDGSHSPASARSLPGRLMLGLINLYRMTAPVRRPRCRYLPTCSEYAAEAIEIHGAGRGLWLAVRRLGRCHPLGSFGFDPVPEK